MAYYKNYMVFGRTGNSISREYITDDDNTAKFVHDAVALLDAASESVPNEPYLIHTLADISGVGKKTYFYGKVDGDVLITYHVYLPKE